RLEDLVVERRAVAAPGRRRPGAVAAIAAGPERLAGVPLEQHEAVRLLDRQPSEQHRVDDAEQRRVGADAERERDDGDGGEARRLAHHAQAVAHVLRELLDEADAARVARLLLELLDAAEAAQRGRARLA